MEAKATLAARGTALDSGDPTPFWRIILLSGRAGRGRQPLTLHNRPTAALPATGYV